MGTGYVRNDTANNIADGNVADASDIDGEFDAVVAAFATSGHTHDGTSAEGGPVTVVGPTQDYIGAAGDFSPKTDSAYDLGKTAVRWANTYLDALDVSGNVVVAGTVDGRDVATDGTKLDTIETSATADQTGAEIKAAYEAESDTNAYTDAEVTKLAGIEASADVTDVTNVTAAGALMDSEVDANIKTFVLPATTTISTFGASLVDDATAATALSTLGLTATAAELNALDGITSTVSELNILDGVTSTTAELNILDGVTSTASELNFVDGVTSNVQTQLDAKAPIASPALTGVPTGPTATAGTNTTQLATTAFVQAVATTSTTWTPRINTAADTATTSQTNQTGQYIRIGNMVTLWFNIRGIAKGDAGSATMVIFDIPYDVGAGTLLQTVGQVITSNVSNITNAHLRMDAGGSEILLLKDSLVSNGVFVTGTDLATSGVELNGTITYYTDDPV